MYGVNGQVCTCICTCTVLHNDRAPISTRFIRSYGVHKEIDICSVIPRLRIVLPRLTTYVHADKYLLAFPLSAQARYRLISF